MDEEETDEQKKRELAEKLRMLRLNSLQQSKSMLRAMQGKNRYRFTNGGKTKRS